MDLHPYVKLLHASWVIPTQNCSDITNRGDRWTSWGIYAMSTSPMRCRITTSCLLQKELQSKAEDQQTWHKWHPKPLVATILLAVPVNVLLHRSRFVDHFHFCDSFVVHLSKLQLNFKLNIKKISDFIFYYWLCNWNLNMPLFFSHRDSYMPRPL